MFSGQDGAGSRDSARGGARRVSPESEMLLELIGLFTHDLSNPLQSLTVLLELALDELSPTAESALKVGQSLEAVERLRQMIRDLSAFARTRTDDVGNLDCATAIRRVIGVLERRFERGSIETTIDLQRLEGAPLPGTRIEFATLSALLGAVSGLTNADHPHLALSIYGEVDGDYGCLRVALRSSEPKGERGEAHPIGDDYVRRSREILGDSAGATSMLVDGALELRWPLNIVSNEPP